MVFFGYPYVSYFDLQISVFFNICLLETNSFLVRSSTNIG